LAQSFPNDLEAHLEVRSLNLLLEPIKNLDDIGVGDLNAAGKGVCDAFAQLSKKFPFNADASVEVTMGELGDLLRPKTGKLWDTYEKKLKNAISCENGRCMAKGNPPVNPAFLSSEEQLMKFSLALYGPDGTDPNLTYKLKPVTSDQVTDFTITVNGQPAVKLKGGEEHSFVFPGPGTPSFKMDYTQAGGSSSGVEHASTWGVFRFFFDADTVNQTPPGYTFTWKVVQGTSKTPSIVLGKPLVYQFFVDTDVFSKFYLPRLKCEPKVTR
jgi:type VI protein secretion system component VasK